MIKIKYPIVALDASRAKEPSNDFMICTKSFREYVETMDEIYSEEEGNLAIGVSSQMDTRYFHRQHLYVLDKKAEIKDGDHFYNEKDNRIELKIEELCIFKPESCHKIIATTDISLNLSLIDFEFVKLFVEAHNNGNPVKQIEMQCEAYTAGNRLIKPEEYQKDILVFEYRSILDENYTVITIIKPGFSEFLVWANKYEYRYGGETLEFTVNSYLNWLRTKDNL